MLDMEKFKENFIRLLNYQEKPSINPLFNIYNQFFQNSRSTEVDFSSFTLEEAARAYEELCCYTTEEDIDYEEDLTANEGNSFHEFCKIDNFFWDDLYNLSPKKDLKDYF